MKAIFILAFLTLVPNPTRGQWDFMSNLFAPSSSYPASGNDGNLQDQVKEATDDGSQNRRQFRINSYNNGQYFLGQQQLAARPQRPQPTTSYSPWSSFFSSSSPTASASGSSLTGQYNPATSGLRSSSTRYPVNQQVYSRPSNTFQTSGTTTRILRPPGTSLRNPISGTTLNSSPNTRPSSAGTTTATSVNTRIRQPLPQPPRAPTRIIQSVPATINRPKLVVENNYRLPTRTTYTVTTATTTTTTTTTTTSTRPTTTTTTTTTTIASVEVNPEGGRNVIKVPPTKFPLALGKNKDTKSEFEKLKAWAEKNKAHEDVEVPDAADFEYLFGGEVVVLKNGHTVQKNQYNPGVRIELHQGDPPVGYKAIPGDDAADPEEFLNGPDNFVRPAASEKTTTSTTTTTTTTITTTSTSASPTTTTARSYKRIRYIPGHHKIHQASTQLKAPTFLQPIRQRVKFVPRSKTTTASTTTSKPEITSTRRLPVYVLYNKGRHTNTYKDIIMTRPRLRLRPVAPPPRTATTTTIAPTRRPTTSGSTTTATTTTTTVAPTTSTTKANINSKLTMINVNGMRKWMPSRWRPMFEAKKVPTTTTTTTASPSTTKISTTTTSTTTTATTATMASTTPMIQTKDSMTETPKWVKTTVHDLIKDNPKDKRFEPSISVISVGKSNDEQKTSKDSITKQAKPVFVKKQPIVIAGRPEESFVPTVPTTTIASEFAPTPRTTPSTMSTTTSTTTTTTTTVSTTEQDHHKDLVLLSVVDPTTSTTTSMPTSTTTTRPSSTSTPPIHRVPAKVFKPYPALNKPMFSHSHAAKITEIQPASTTTTTTVSSTSTTSTTTTTTTTAKPSQKPKTMDLNHKFFFDRYYTKGWTSEDVKSNRNENDKRERQMPDFLKYAIPMHEAIKSAQVGPISQRRLDTISLPEENIDDEENPGPPSKFNARCRFSCRLTSNAHGRK